MQAIILAGGMGTRLRPLTYTVPKPMLPVALEPAMAHTVRSLERAGFNEVIVTTNYLAEVVTEGIEEWGPPIPVRCVKEHKALGTAGCIKNLIDELDDEFLVIQGDAVADIDYERFLNFHREHEADVTISVMRVQDTREFGIVAVEDDGHITRFQEKPRPEEAFSNLANSGFYVLKKSTFDNVPANEEYDFSRQLFPALMAQGARFYAWEMRSYWVDIGRVQTYLEGNRHQIQGRAEVAADVRVPESSTLLPPFLIGEGTRIGEGCTIGPGAIIARRCTLGHGSRVSGSVLYDDVSIGENTRLTDCVVAKNAHLGDNVSIEPMSVIGEGCDIGSDVQVMAHSRVGPVVPVAAGTVVEGVVSPRMEKLESLQRKMAHAVGFRDLPHDQLIICSLLAAFGEMTARDLSQKAEIPFSRVHTVLLPLEADGLILSTMDVPKRYALSQEDPRLGA
ncbi:MAG: mannose-phosphate guanylyltransferase / phosphomannomutase [Abditibacteriota bacterium]|nr:mannose-phosphate guanylyltransferase / phosphomannomutase [Abditibacteriota bacterium]